MTRDMSKGVWVRRMTRDEFRAMKNGDTIRVVINTPMDIESLRSQASKMSFISGCHFCVNYERGKEFATVTRLENKEEKILTN